MTDSSDHPDLKRFLEPDRVGILRVVPIVVAVATLVLVIVGLVVLRPTGKERPDLSEIGINALVYDARVVSVEKEPCDFSPDVTCAEVVFLLTEGPDTGTEFEQFVIITETSPDFHVGDRVVLDYQVDAEPAFRYSYFDRQRRPVLLWVAIAFAIVVVALGRLRGLAALVGLAGSVIVLMQFVIPAILDGRNPVLVAIVGAALIAYLALYAAHGFTTMTTIALLGTLAALAFTAVLSWIVVNAAAFTGFTDDAAFIVSIAGHFDFSGLILAGVVLGALGAIDDITVTQASTVWEIHRVRPDLGRGELLRSGLRIGRDHVASTVNTLLLAYAGAAMPLLLFFVLSNQSVGTVLNSEIVAVEVVRTLVGSIGLVSAVPFTTWLAAVFATEDFGGDGHAHLQ